MSDQPRVVAGNPAAQPYVDQVRRDALVRMADQLRHREARLSENAEEHLQAHDRIAAEIEQVQEQLSEVLLELERLR